MHERPREPRLALLVCGLLACAAAGAADWPRFRGPNGTGVAADKDVPVRWADRDVLWKAALPGAGHSSPIVSNGRVFVQSATGKERVLVCLDAVTGKQLWSRAAPGGRARIHPRNSHASSTPAADGERVYAAFWNGRGVGLSAYDFTGKLVWENDLGGFRSQHGAGFSPVVYDGKVILNYDQDGSAVLLAFDAKSGKKAWEVKRAAYRACYSTPFLLRAANAAAEPAGQLIVASTAGITAYNPRGGEELWSYTWSFPGMPLRTVGSPVAVDGLIVAAAGDGSGDRAMIAVRTGGKGDVTKTHLAWSKDTGTPYVPTLLASGGHLYGVLDKGFAVCYSAKTGAELWRKRLAETDVSSSPVLIDGKVYAATDKGEVFVYEASPDGYKGLARNSLGEPVASTPAVANGRLYVRGRDHLFCIGKSGK
jgi:outer membrane protein assembly factor BamB